MSKVLKRQKDVPVPRQPRLGAAADVWYLWIIGVVGFVASAYFFTHPDIWAMNAEQFYVLIFAGASFLAIVAGAYRIYSRPKVSA